MSVPVTGDPNPDQGFRTFWKAASSQLEKTKKRLGKVKGGREEDWPGGKVSGVAESLLFLECFAGLSSSGEEGLRAHHGQRGGG